MEGNDYRKEYGEVFLEMPVSELDLTERSLKCLDRQGVKTIKQLISCSSTDLSNIRNLGEYEIEDIKRGLLEVGLKLNDE